MAKRVHNEDASDAFYKSGQVFMVRCPRCDGRAEYRVIPSIEAPHDRQGPRLVCTSCSLTRQADSPFWRYCKDGRDPYFGLPLWLQTNCRGKVLWAYGPQHVAHVESYIGAEIRERRRHPKWGWSNKSMESRLPRWMVLAKNRDPVLKALNTLRDRALVSE